MCPVKSTAWRWSRCPARCKGHPSLNSQKVPEQKPQNTGEMGASTVSRIRRLAQDTIDITINAFGRRLLPTDGGSSGPLILMRLNLLCPFFLHRRNDINLKFDSPNNNVKVSFTRILSQASQPVKPGKDCLTFG